MLGIVTSCDPALVEVSADAALHVDAGDDAAWERAIVEAVGSPNDRASSPPDGDVAGNRAADRRRVPRAFRAARALTVYRDRSRGSRDDASTDA